MGMEFKIILLNTLFILCVIIGYKLSYKENVENRIAGGKPASEKQYPWHATIAVQKAETKALCGGALISREWILTSAQCIDEGEMFSIGLGKTNLDDYEIAKLLKSKTAMKHEEYDKITLENDIGLIKLPRKVIYSERVNASRLPSRKYSLELLEKETVYLSGHGSNKYISGKYISPNLTSLDVKTVTLNRCMDFYGQEVINFNVICATAADGHGPCYNDTGDPLIIYQSDNYATLIGIFSYFHEEGCDLAYPSVYTRVGTHIDWISSKTGIKIVEDSSTLNEVAKFIVTSFLILLAFVFILQLTRLKAQAMRADENLKRTPNLKKK